MPHIIFNRDRYTPLYATIGGSINHTIIRKSDIKIGIFINSIIDILKQYNGEDALKFNISMVSHKYDEFNIFVNKPFRDLCFKSDYINTIISEFDIDCSPYDVGEKVYVSSTNEFHELISRHRDDIGNWIYKTKLANNIGYGNCDEIYTDEEKLNFELIKSENSILINEQMKQVEIDKQEAIEQINEIIDGYYKNQPPLQVGNKYDYYDDIINTDTSLLRKIMNKFGL